MSGIKERIEELNKQLQISQNRLQQAQAITQQETLIFPRILQQEQYRLMMAGQEALQMEMVIL